MSSPSASVTPAAEASERGADRAARGPREHAPGTRARGLGRRGGAPRGAHHQRLGDAPLRACLRQRVQVAAEQGGEVGVDHRRRAAFVLTEGRQHLVRGRHVDLGQRLADGPGDAALVRGVAESEQQADRHRLGAALGDRGRQPLGFALGQRIDDPVGADALGRLQAQLRGDEGRGPPAAGVVEAGPALAPDVQQVGEAAGGDQGGAGASLLQQRVGPDRHPVRESLDRGRVRPSRGQHGLGRGDHAAGLVPRRGRDLRRVQPVAVEQRGVGEGPTDIDPEQHAPTI